MAERAGAGPDPALGVDWSDAGLGDEALARAQLAVEGMAERLSLAGRNAAYEELSWDPGSHSELPTLHLDDVSAIPFLIGISGVEEYQHRARLRAGDGDLFAASTPSTPGYEEYCRDVLGMGQPELLMVDPIGPPIAVSAALTHGPLFGRLVERAREAGGLAIHPYMGIEAVWELARKLRDEAGVPVGVLAPPDPVTWLANDKQLMSETVCEVLGDSWVVETRSSACPVELTGHLLTLSQRHARVGLKRTRCASGMGNQIYDLNGQAHDELEPHVRGFLERTEWDGAEEVLVVAWEDASHSPSTQLWIPPREQGPPRLDGIYEQLLKGEERVFVGSRPSRLPAAVNWMIGRAALQVSAAFQAMGYVGRCSFDHLIVGDPEGEFSIRFTECNGRWGGTSSPMSFVERLVGNPRPPYRAQDFIHEDLVGVPFSEVLERVGDALYRPDTREGRFLFYNVGPLLESGKLDVIAFGETQEEAERALTEELPALLGVNV
jgi:hypothetical protein